MKKILSILGSTGSIGTNTLTIVSQFKDRFSIGALAGYKNVDKLAVQIERFKPKLAVVKNRKYAEALKKKLHHNYKVEILYGEAGYQTAAALDGVDIVVGAMVGAAGLLPILAAINAGKSIALANKETLVMAGELVMSKVSANKIRFLPIDSEHSAIFQCLNGNRRQDLEQILLTASGGPFRQLPADKFEKITPKDALNHPNWNMGSKITIDSATLMNKGLEIIEARWLFDVPYQQIKVIVHPQSIVHSMVAFKDGSVIAQMGIPDMKGAISYALTYPERFALEQPFPDFNALAALTFEDPDFNRFPCLALAYKACALGGTMPSVLNAANEMAVEAFLAHKIPFTAIFQVIKDVMASHEISKTPDLNGIMTADKWARDQAKLWISELGVSSS